MRPSELPGEDNNPFGNGSASVAMNVKPLLVVGVNSVGVEKPGWNITFCVTI